MFGPNHFRYVPYLQGQSSRFQARIAKERFAFLDRIAGGSLECIEG